MNARYVVDENGERVAVLIDIEEYERIFAQHHAPTADDEALSPEEEELDPEEAEHRITEFVTSAEEHPCPLNDRAEVEAGVVGNERDSEEFPKGRK